MKRHLIAALVVVAALIAGALGLFGRHIGSAAIAVDNWLREALYKLQSEPIDPGRRLLRLLIPLCPSPRLLPGVC